MTDVEEMAVACHEVVRACGDGTLEDAIVGVVLDNAQAATRESDGGCGEGRESVLNARITPADLLPFRILGTSSRMNAE